MNPLANFKADEPLATRLKQITSEVHNSWRITDLVGIQQFYPQMERRNRDMKTWVLHDVHEEVKERAEVAVFWCKGRSCFQESANIEYHLACS